MNAKRRLLLALVSLLLLGGTAACSAAEDITGPQVGKPHYTDGMMGSGGYTG